MTLPVPRPHDLAAGGVVERYHSGRCEIAVVKRATHQDFSLPKGHPEGEETWQQAAVREVLEETGCTAQCIGGPLPTSFLKSADMPKMVVYFRMSLLQQGELIANEEVERVLWLPPADAIRQLSHDSERALVQQLYPQQPWAVHSLQAAGRFLFGADSQAPLQERRLHTGIQELRLRIATQRRLEQAQARSVDSDPTATSPTASAMLSRHPQPPALSWTSLAPALEQALSLAEDASLAGNTELGWKHLAFARRQALKAATHEERVDQHHMLTRETADKLSGWRLQAAQDALKAEDGEEPQVASLIQSQWILDEHFDNVYMRMGIARRFVSIFPRVLWMLLALLWIFALAREPTPLPTGGTTGEVTDPWTGKLVFDAGRLFLMALLGTVGAAFSVAIDARMTNKKIPDMLNQASVMRLRLATGAASAVILTVLLECDLFERTAVHGPGLMAFALGAGFSDRLAKRALESLANATDKKTQTPAADQ